MKTTIENASQFRDAFITFDRKDQFSYEGYEALFDYLEEIDPDMELDVIALCCDYTEFKTALEATEEMTSEKFEVEDDAMEHLNNNTSVITFDGGIIVANF